MTTVGANSLRRLWPIVALLVCLPATRCSRPPESQSKRRPPPVGQFPAFGGGGPLHNVAPAIGGPPMKVRWTYQAPDACNAAPVIDDTCAYIADAGGDLVALDLATAAKRWTFHSPAGFSATPLIAGDTLYIGDLAGEFFALDLPTGKPRWTFPGGSPVHAGANTDGQRILFGTDAGLIHCLDLAGQQQWTARADGRINAPPALLDGVAVFTSCDARVRALRIADGSELFNVDVGNLVPGSACATDAAYYIGTDQGQVLSLAPKDGVTQWTFDAIVDAAMVYASPAASEDILVVAARDSHVYGLRPNDGERLWSFAAGAAIDASPVVSDQRVYVASKDRRLHVLSLADGKHLWAFETARPVNAPVAIAQGVLVMGDVGGTVYCLEPQ